MVAKKKHASVAKTKTFGGNKRSNKQVTPLRHPVPSAVKVETKGLTTKKVPPSKEGKVDTSLLDPFEDVAKANRWIVENLCLAPSNFFGGMESRNESNSASNPTPGTTIDTQGILDELRNEVDEHKSLAGCEDFESIGSASTIWNVFSDLTSLPSIPDQRLPLLSGDEDIDDSSLLTLGNLSAMSGKKQETEITSQTGLAKWEDDSLKSQVSLSYSMVENEVEKKINEANLDKELTSLESTISLANVRSKRSDFGRILKAIKFTEDEVKPIALTRFAASEEVKRLVLVKELRKAVDAYGRYDVRCANMNVGLGDLYVEHNELDQALKFYKEAVSIYSAKLGDHHVTTMDARIRLGSLFLALRNYDDAIASFYHVLEMRKALRGERDPSVSDALTLISKALREKGRSTQAIKELKRALKMYRESLGDTHPRIAITADEIASLYMAQGDCAKAAAILQEVVKLKAATSGINNAEVAKTLMALGDAFEGAGEYVNAMKSLKKAYSVHAAVYGENSDQATMSLERIALNYRAQGDLHKTVAAYLGVLRGRKLTLGSLHPKVAHTFLQLGIYLHESQQFEKALKCMKQSLSIYMGEGKGMNDISMIAEVMREIALVYKRKGQLTTAQKIFKQELTIRQKMGPVEVPRIARTLYHLGVTEYEMGNLSRALSYLMEALAIYEKTPDEVSIDFAETLFHTGLVFEATKHPDRAVEAFVESLKIFKAHGLTDTSPMVSAASGKLTKAGGESKRTGSV